MDAPVENQPRRFYDGGPVDGQPDPTAPPIISLERTEDMAEQEFRLRRRIAYLDRHVGELLVPLDPDDFTTDLTSVPDAFGWLVPRVGKHLPAALLHDGLTCPPTRPTYISTEGVQIDREEANRIFRDALADTGTPLIRRWLLWTAAAVFTMVFGRGTSWSPGESRRWRWTAIGTIAVITVLGVLATLDGLDVDLPLIGSLPWMGERAWWLELAGGIVAAIVAPALLALAWGRFWKAGIIAGISLGLLLHVTVAVAALTALYRLAERVVARATD